MMRTLVAPSRGRKTAFLKQLSLVAAMVVLAPAFAFAQGSNVTTTTATEAPAVADGSATSTAAADTAAAGAVSIAPGTVMSYTQEQADRGKTAYVDNCSVCHGTTLGGSGEAPGLAGKGFRERWFVGSPGPLFDYIHHNMPQQAPGSLDMQTYADITAYLMSRNRVPVGDAEFPPDDAAAANITLPPLTE